MHGHKTKDNLGASKQSFPKSDHGSFLCYGLFDWQESRSFVLAIDLTPDQAGSRFRHPAHRSDALVQHLLLDRGRPSTCSVKCSYSLESQEAAYA